MTAMVGLATRLKLCRVLQICDAGEMTSRGGDVVAMVHRPGVPVSDVTLIEEREPKPYVKGVRQLGRRCITMDGCRAAFAERGIGFVVIPGEREMIALAAQAAPPSDPDAVLWFVQGPIAPHTWPELAALGCRRAALACGSGDVQATDDVLRSIWNDDPAMERVVFAAFG